MRVRRPVERVGRADDGAQRSVGEQAQQVGDRLGEQAGSLQRRARARSRSPPCCAPSARRRRSASAGCARPSRTPRAGRAGPARRGSGRRPCRRSSRARCRPRLPSLASRSAAVRSSARESTATSAPRSRRELRACPRDDAVAMTRPAPHRLASWIAIVPTPPAPACTTTRLAGLQVRRWCAAGATRSRPARAWSARRRRDTASGIGNSVRRVDARSSRRSRRRRRSPSSRGAVRVADDDLAARDQRQRLLGQVGVLGLVGVGVVDAGGERRRRPACRRRPRDRATSLTTRVSGPPNSVIWIARMTPTVPASTAHPRGRAGRSASVECVDESIATRQDGAGHRRQPRHRPGDRAGVRRERRPGRGHPSRQRRAGRPVRRAVRRHLHRARSTRRSRAVEAELGPVEVLVANAGITDDTLLLRMSEESFQRVVDANLTGAYRVAQAGGARACCAPAGAG